MKKIATFIIAMVIIRAAAVQAFAHDYAMSFLYGGTNEQYINCVQNANGVINSVSPDYFEINEDGGLKRNKIDRHFISVMHDKGVKVMPFISNHWDRKRGQAALDHVETLTTELARVVYEYDMDGVNIDIENISEKRKEDYTYFVASLRHKMPGKTLCVSVAANPNNWQTGWHGSYDYKRLADNSDYLLVMGYDESYYGSKPGPVASASFTEKSLEYALKEVPAEKIVLGIPFFGRYWKQGDKVGGHGLTVMDINNLISRYPHYKVYHEDTQSAQVTLTIGNNDTPPKVWGGRVLQPGVYEIWYDDMQATAYKLNLVNQYRLKGSGSWALGQDSTEMWNAYAQYKAGTAPQATSTPVPTQMPYAAPAPSYTPVLVNTSAYTPAQSPEYPNMNAYATAAPGNTISNNAQATPQPAQNTMLHPYNASPTRSSARVTYSVPGRNTSLSGNTIGGQNVNTTGEYGTQAQAQSYGTQPQQTTSNLQSQIYGTTQQSNNMQAQSQPQLQQPQQLQSQQPQVASQYMMPSNTSRTLSDDARAVIDKGWLSAEGYDENRYATHGEAIAMIMKMAALLPDSNNMDHFTDTAQHPQGASIRKAREYGIVTGDGDGNYRPDRVLTRKDLALYLDRVFDLPDTVNFEQHYANDLYKDNNIAASSRETNADYYYAVQKYLAHGIMQTDTYGNFRPNDPVSMGELTRIARKMEGRGLKSLTPLYYNGQKQKQKILEPR